MVEAQIASVISHVLASEERARAAEARVAELTEQLAKAHNDKKEREDTIQALTNRAMDQTHTCLGACPVADREGVVKIWNLLTQVSEANGAYGHGETEDDMSDEVEEESTTDMSDES